MLSVSAWVSAGFIVLAAIAMAYSLHIVFHEVVHRRFFRHPVTKLLSESAITALLGMPFNEYRQSHWRHHRYTNLLQDSTSTWKLTPAGPKPRNCFVYIFVWPLLAPGSLRALLDEARDGLQSRETINRVMSELVLVGLIHLFLFFYSMPLWLIYSSTVYLGWAGIAAVNYIQHPPVEYGSGYTTSFYSPTYNVIFYNNGLHFEHHDRVQEPVIELSPTPGDWRLYAEGRRIRRERPNLTNRALEETDAAIGRHGGEVRRKAGSRA
jgi:fatty acid desaturase